ncbi:DUF4192 domain-containing protein [Amycolatopsis tucumanensis]|uniref:DUF4192 domain-containing protein n=1 Tax=Amycolatopsis tucumanensis TaxID=401106 RepID=A0ABP7IJ30_9PSEU|nr:DUF4192 domain-containing protein [Amycolatopsis tucumanensis]MCF6424434.1 DUF4192 domain-containing protein [Amycolatopsis tucumanensis]
MTSTTTNTGTDGRITVRISDPGELIAAVPHLLTYRPGPSVVLLNHGGRERMITPVIRADLPDEACEPDMAGDLVRAVLRHPGAGVTVVIIGRHPGHRAPPGRLPHHGLARRLTSTFGNAGRPVDHALWVPEIRGGARWRCYHERCLRGVLPDDRETVLAATMATSGQVTYGSREEMARLLDPDDPAAITRRQHMLDEAIDNGLTRPSPTGPASKAQQPTAASTVKAKRGAALGAFTEAKSAGPTAKGGAAPGRRGEAESAEPAAGGLAGWHAAMGGAEPGWCGEAESAESAGGGPAGWHAAMGGAEPDWFGEAQSAEHLAVVRAALARAVAGDFDLSDEDVVSLAMALSDLTVRDRCLTTADPPGDPPSTAAERLWLELVRRTPMPERAEPAVLLGYSAYRRGDGVLAALAFDNALAAHPGHRLAELLRICLSHQLPPDTLRRLSDCQEGGLMPS